MVTDFGRIGERKYICDVYVAGEKEVLLLFISLVVIIWPLESYILLLQ